MPRLAAAFLVILAFVLTPSIAPAQDKQASLEQGRWRFEKDAAGAPSLSFVRDGKVVFLVRAGREISIWLAYPAKVEPKGKSRITIDTGERRWRLNGELTAEEQGGVQVPYFVQRDMGMTDRKKKWGNLMQRYNRFIEALTGAQQIAISTRHGDVRLPRIDIADARREMQL